MTDIGLPALIPVNVAGDALPARLGDNFARGALGA